MQINELPTSTIFNSTDVIALEINGVTYKIAGASLAAALTKLGMAADPALVTFTAGSGVTVTRNNSVVVGKYIFVSVLIQTTAAITGAATTILTLPSGNTVVRMADLTALTLNGTAQYSLVAVGGSNIIRGNMGGSVSMPAGYYHIVGTIGLT
ncbi:MAG: hypothetical protein Q4C10_06290 [Clostridia bacterium]|nr:hypothetical protein [Clostridia bacterium]